VIVPFLMRLTRSAISNTWTKFVGDHDPSTRPALPSAPDQVEDQPSLARGPIAASGLVEQLCLGAEWTERAIATPGAGRPTGIATSELTERSVLIPMSSMYSRARRRIARLSSQRIGPTPRVSSAA
jgi:hypothetical protein